jgi:hypothetical protein
MFKINKKKKIFVIFTNVIYIALMVFIVTCRIRENTNPLDPQYEGPIDYVVSDKIFSIDKLNNVSVVDTTGGVYTMIYTGPKPDISKGTILTGSEGYGYLRYVTSVQSVGSNKIKAQTRQAALTEAVIMGSIDTTITLMTEGENYKLKRAIHGVKVKEGFIDLTDITLYNGKVSNVDLKVKILRGRVTFNPSLHLGCRIEDNEVVEFDAIVRGQLIFDCDLECDVSSPLNFNHERTIYEYYYITGQMIGPIPVIEVISFKFNAGFYANWGIAGTLKSGFESSTSLEVGVRLKNEEWIPIWNPNLDFNPRPIEWEETGNINIKGYIKPSISVEFYAIAGPYLELPPYLDFISNVDYIPPDLYWTWKLYGGIEGQLGLRIHILDNNLFDYNTTFLNHRILIYEDSGIIRGSTTTTTSISTTTSTSSTTTTVTSTSTTSIPFTTSSTTTTTSKGSPSGSVDIISLDPPPGSTLKYGSYIEITVRYTLNNASSGIICIEFRPIPQGVGGGLCPGIIHADPGTDTVSDHATFHDFGITYNHTSTSLNVKFYSNEPIVKLDEFDYSATYYWTK